MIHPLNTDGYTKDVWWCAPSAVALLTGRPLTETTAALARIAGVTYEKLEGCWPEETVLALYEFGYRSTPIPVIDRFRDTVCGPTLKRFMGERTPIEKANPMLIEVDGHMLVGYSHFLFDNGTPTGLGVDHFPKMKRLVKQAWTVTKMPG